MKMMHKKLGKTYAFKIPFLTVILMMVVLVLAGCGPLKLSSRWLKSEISIDGKINDWKGKLVYLDKKKISFGLQNDDQSLYICLVTGERSMQMQIIRQGLNLWFDPQGGDKKVYGIKFPVGDQTVEVIPGKSGIRPDPEDFIDAFRDNLSEIEILDQGGTNGFRIPVKNLKGLKIELRFNQGLLIYEVKVPLKHRDDYSFAIGIDDLNKIGIGLETPSMKMSDMRGMRPEGKSGIRMGGPQGGRSGMPGGGRGMRPPGGMGMKKPKLLKLWVEVALARGEKQ